MATGCATVNLGFAPAKARTGGSLLRHLLAFEAWLDRRTSSRALSRMNDRELADIGLSRADVEGLVDSASWPDALPPAGR